jgi:hypothetical protein
MSKLLKMIVGLLLSLTFALKAETTIQVTRGADCASHMRTLTALRLSTFKEFPYLYIGDESYENIYSSGFPSNPDTLFAIAYVDDEFAGILTGTPLEAIMENEPEAVYTWNNANADISKYFYYGEVIVVQKFRKSDIATLLARALEKEIPNLGYQNVCFITVDREENHPLRPENYQSIEKFLPRKGYSETNMKSYYAWPTLQEDGTVEVVLNTVSWWIKSL